MTQEHEFGAIPLFLQGRDLVVLNLVAFENTEGVDEDPRQGSTEVDQFVHRKGHDTRGENIVLHPGIPSHPELLGNIEVGVELGDFLILAPVGVGQHRGVPVHTQRSVGNARKSRRGARVHCVSLERLWRGREREKRKKIKKDGVKRAPGSRGSVEVKV